jgi:hypothetical protein
MITQHRTMRQTKLLTGLLIAMLLLCSLGISQTRAQPRPIAGPSAADLLVYGDALAAGWEDWSWDSAVNLANTAVVQQGAAAAAVTYQAAYAGFSLRAPSPISTSGYTAIAFGVYGAAGGSQLELVTQATDSGSAGTAYALTAPAGVWTSVTVPLTALGSPAAIARINLQDASGAAQPTIYVDNMRLVGGSGGGFPDPTPDRELTFSRSMAGVAIAPSGRLYASSWRESKIYSWAKAANANNPASSADMIFGTAMDPENANPANRCGAPSATSFCGPEGLAVDQSGNLYVAATYHNRVLIFLNPETDADPQTADLVIEGMLDAPRGLALDASGNLYVVDEFNYRVLVFNQPLTTDTAPDVIIGGTQGGGNNQFSLPLGVAVSSAGHLYVTDLFNQRVMRFNAPLTSGMSATQIYSGFDAPHDLALDQAGNLYVADVLDAEHAPPNPPDSKNSRVAVIATPLSNTAISYELPNVAYPLGMDFDAAGNLYVALCVGPYPCDGGGKLLVFNAPATPPPGTLALQVNASADQRPISPYIYGMNSYGLSAATFATLAQDLRLPLQRWGGNITTRYNWKNDMANHGSDWYFENIPEDNPNPASGNAADHFIARGETSATESLVTIPLIGYVSKNRTTPNGAYDCSFSITKYNYTPAPLYPGGAATDPDNPASAHCGTGKRTNGTLVTGNDPADTSIVVGPAYMQDWVEHLVTRFGTAASGGVRFYGLDNEPGLWHETHRDVHPQHATYAELTNLGQQYAKAIKAADPTALTLGPVQDGWARYFYASYTENPDPVAQQDRDAHGGTPFVAWYLQQMAAASATAKIRLLDYFDLHYYPQADGVSLAPAGSAATQALRLRSTRALWDPTYVDESWIAGTEEGNMAVRLIPRMRDWVSANYPGTKLAISEYNWGALDHINGALAQADVLGIFGREGVDLATLWGAPTPSQPGAFAFRMYRNYDGQGGRFGDTSVRASSADQSQLAIYAARRKSDGALTLMIINKTGGALTSSVGLAGFTPSGSAKVYSYSASSLGSILHQADQAVSASGFTGTFAASSITLMVLPSADGPLPEYQVFVPLVRR